jgi:glycosyltransferase involved in cell wall biosynthesis
VPPTPIRLTRIIARLNVGGPAIQAITLTAELSAYGFQTRLVRGVEDPAEGNMDYLAAQLGVRPTKITALRRDPGPGELQAIGALVRLLRRDRPQIVHTHAAKAGTLGRLATLIAFPDRRRRPLLVHTYHGHSLTGYFTPAVSAVYREIERRLAAPTDVLIAVSSEVRNDLVRLGVADTAKFRVVPLGFDLSAFVEEHDRAERRRRLREQWRITPRNVVVTLVARLVPIKRIDRFLALARRLCERYPEARFVIVGDGELRKALQRSPDALVLGDRLTWAGFHRDMADVYFASDIVALTSDNEGTPVSLIEAQAAAVPVLATDVGGVRSVVADGVSGLLAAPGDSGALVAGATRLLDDTALRERLGNAGRERVTARFTLDRLVADHVALYRELLARRASAARRAR